MNTAPGAAQYNPDTAIEINFDGLVGPTHHYAGLSYGNIASDAHRHLTSNPRAAALQGLEKMKYLADLGIPQAILPPQWRPDPQWLLDLGFSGDPAQLLAQVNAIEPALLAATCSASSMWSANAATLSPSADSTDGKVHFTPANLISNYHRSLETAWHQQLLQQYFANPEFFTHHPALPAQAIWADEGAANHNRLCPRHGAPGVELFVYGQSPNLQTHPLAYPARQTLQASQALARHHQVKHALFAQQHPDAIDAGVFHNDVICVANQNLMLYHQRAFADQDVVIQKLEAMYQQHCQGPLHLIEISSSELTLQQAVSSYLFNSQIITLNSGKMLMLVPSECESDPAVWALLQRLLAADNPIDKVISMDLRQSMNNGGGPACLRLRVVLTPEQLAAVPAGVFLNADNYPALKRCIDSYYPDQLTLQDLADPQLHQINQRCLDRISQILQLDCIYPFQK